MNKGLGPQYVFYLWQHMNGAICGKLVSKAKYDKPEEE